MISIHIIYLNRKEFCTMTRLELAICEAENNGDIDIYTRDMMLDIINESTAQSRRVSRMEEKMNKLMEKMTALEKMRKKYIADGDNSKVDIVDKQIDKLRFQLNTIRRDQHKIDPTYSALASYSSGKSAAKAIADMKKYKNDPSTRGTAERLRDDANFWANVGHAHAKENPLRGNSKREVERAGRYRAIR